MESESKLRAADAQAAQDLSASEEKSAGAIAELNNKIKELELEVSTTTYHIGKLKERRHSNLF